jgi:hypothetical protein
VNSSPLDLQAKDLLLFLLGVAVTVLVSYVFYRRSLPKTQLCFTLDIQNTGDADFHYLIILVWNGGILPIKRADLETTDPLRLDTGGRRPSLFSKAEIRYQSRRSNNVKLDGDFLTFDYLNPGDGFLCELIAKAETVKYDDDRNLIEPPISLIGEIVASKNAPVFYQMQRIEVSAFELLAFFALPALFSALGIFYWLTNHDTILGVVVLYLTLCIPLVVLISFVYVIVLARLSDKLPRRLRLAARVRRAARGHHAT